MQSHLVEGFEALVVPRFEEDARHRFPACLLSQQAFWSALRFSLINRVNVDMEAEQRSVELRLVSNVLDHSVRVYVLMWSSSDIDASNGLLGRLLPTEFIWRPLERSEFSSFLAGPENCPALSIARIIRRMELVDLPRVMLGESKDAPQGAAQTTSITREIPTISFVSRMQLLAGRYCVPVLGEFEQTDGDWKRICEELLRAAPAVLSFAVFPISRENLESDRLVGSHMSTFVDLISGQLETAGFSQLGSARRSCDRYLMNASHLGDLRIRVAAGDPRDCIAVSHAVVARFGGMRAFEIKYPTRSFPDLEKLTDAELDFPMSSDGWDSTLARLDRRLTQESVKLLTHEGIRRYLVRLPHCYTDNELGQLLEIPSASEEGVPGIRTRLLPPFHPASMRHQPVMEAEKYAEPPASRVRIGRIMTGSGNDDRSADSCSHWHTIEVADLAKHALIVGGTGSGKTVVASFLFREIDRLGLPVLVIEPVKTEYYDQLSAVLGPKRVKRYRFEAADGDGWRDPSYFLFDPMRLQHGVSVSRHVSYLKSCFEAAFPMEPWMGLLLENAIMEYYTGDIERGCCGLKLFSRGGPHTLFRRRFVYGPDKGKDGGVFPSFRTFSSFFLEHFLDREFPHVRASGPGDQTEQMRQVFRRRFINLSHGPLGQAFFKADLAFLAKDSRDPIRDLQLLKRHSVVELDGIPDGEQKSLVMAFLMTFLFEARQAEDQQRRLSGVAGPNSLQHVLIVEEAHRLLSNTAAVSSRGGDSAGMDSKAKAVSLFSDMLAEIRAYGQGIVVVEQIPTKIIPEAVKNTNLKIMLRLTSKDDRDYLGAAMNFNEEQKRFITSLRAERGRSVQYVVFDESVDQPVLLSLPLRSDPGPLFDQYF